MKNANEESLEDRLKQQDKLTTSPFFNRSSLIGIMTTTILPNCNLARSQQQTMITSDEANHVTRFRPTRHRMKMIANDYLSPRSSEKCKFSTSKSIGRRRRTSFLPSSSSLIVIFILFLMNENWFQVMFVQQHQTAVNDKKASGNLHTQIGRNYLVEAVSVQRLQVPDLVVVSQQVQQPLQLQLHQPRSAGSGQRQQTDLHKPQPEAANQQPQQPEAASLINGGQALQQVDANQLQHTQRSVATTAGQSSNQFTFECLVSFDKRKDKNLIVKWHHDERNEPIYQWIPELNKRSIAPQYRPFILPTIAINGNGSSTGYLDSLTQAANASDANQFMLEAGFKLIRPSKELGGKYTCSAISSQNDDSKSKKMIVYSPPRTFKFNATRTDLGSIMTNQRDRLIQLIQPANVMPAQTMANANQLPLAYRMRGLIANGNANNNNQMASTISPQMYSNIDYVNVNQQRLASSAMQTSGAMTNYQNYPGSLLMNNRQPQFQQQPQQAKQQYGVKLICDIDQVFPVPEVSIYRLGKSIKQMRPNNNYHNSPDLQSTITTTSSSATTTTTGLYPEKMAKLDTKIERDLNTGLYNIQVTSILDDDELQMKYGTSEPVYFECLIALTNLELSKYADNKRTIVYRPGSVANGLQSGEDIRLLDGQQQYGSSSAADKRRTKPTNLTGHYSMMILLAIVSLVLILQRLKPATVINIRAISRFEPILSPTTTSQR